MGTFPIVMYHRVEDSAYIHERGLRLSGEHCSLRRFRSQLEMLARQHTVLPLTRLVDAIRYEEEVPRNAAAITFDDGTRDHIEVVLPELLELGLQATFFVLSGPLEGKIPPTFKMQLLTGGAIPLQELAEHLFPDVLRRLGTDLADEYEAYRNGERSVPVERYIGEQFEAVRQMKWLVNYVMPSDIKEIVVASLFDEVYTGKEEQLCREMFLGATDIERLGATGMTIGSHTRSHYNLSTIHEPELLVEEIVNSKTKIAKAARIAPTLFAYPAGGKEGYTRESIRLVADHYSGAVITGSQKELCSTTDSVFELPRVHEKYLSL